MSISPFSLPLPFSQYLFLLLSCPVPFVAPSGHQRVQESTWPGGTPHPGTFCLAYAWVSNTLLNCDHWLPCGVSRVIKGKWEAAEYWSDKREAKVMEWLQKIQYICLYNSTVACFYLDYKCSEALFEGDLVIIISFHFFLSWCSFKCKGMTGWMLVKGLHFIQCFRKTNQ